MQTGDGGEALVHRRMFSGTGRRGDDSVRGSGDERATEGSIVDCRGGSKCGFGEDRRTGAV